MTARERVDLDGHDDADVTWSNIQGPDGDASCIHTNPMFNAPAGAWEQVLDIQATDDDAAWEPGALVGAFLNPDVSNTPIKKRMPHRQGCKCCSLLFGHENLVENANRLKERILVNFLDRTMSNKLPSN